jgi:type II secretory pathway pseudopilin PulG
MNILNRRNDRAMARVRRRGLVSVSVLIVLLVIGLVCAGLLKVALTRRAEVGMEERRLQAGWLAESGMDRAVARLMESNDYSGETWEIPAGDLGGRGAATVAIQVEPVPDRPDRKKVRVQADYPSGSSLRARQSRSSIVVVKSSSR